MPPPGRAFPWLGVAQFVLGSWAWCLCVLFTSSLYFQSPVARRPCLLAHANYLKWMAHVSTPNFSSVIIISTPDFCKSIYFASNPTTFAVFKIEKTELRFKSRLSVLSSFSCFCDACDNGDLRHALPLEGFQILLWISWHLCHIYEYKYGQPRNAVTHSGSLLWHALHKSHWRPMKGLNKKKIVKECWDIIWDALEETLKQVIEVRCHREKYW